MSVDNKIIPFERRKSVSDKSIDNICKKDFIPQFSLSQDNVKN